MADPLLDIPQELCASFDYWQESYADYAWRHDSEGIEDYEGRTLCIGVSGGEYEKKGRALASRSRLRRLGIDGRTIPQPLIDAIGAIPKLERLHLGNVGPRALSPLVKLGELRSLYLEGIRGAQQLSIANMAGLESVSIGGDSHAVASVLQQGNVRVRCVQLWGTVSTNLKLPDLEMLRRLPSVEYLVLGNVSVGSRSLEPCLELPGLRQVIVNHARSWDRGTIDELQAKEISIRYRADEIRAQLL